MNLSPERFKEIAAAFGEIADLPRGERAAAVAALEARDPEAAREVRALLEHERGTDGFLQTPVLGARVDLWAAQAKSIAEEELSGEIVGHYRLVRKIASGGMGTVYLGERADGQFEQQVAIKLIKRGLDTDEVLKRFQHERQTLAALNHPSIARLLDGGATESGRPYLVMEYVDGRPIDEYCREHELSIEQRLGLFLKVCEAVHYAHQNLVVHRDIKPQNVLVGESGLPKLVDFGVAKVLGDGGQSSVTMEVGSRFTPEYASPEQVLGQPVTTATDTYSLGVLLYELLAERPPYVFATRSPAELRALVCEQEPPPPSAPAPRTLPGTHAQESVTQLRPALQGDLDRIVLMAMRKEPHRRYASVEQLAADLQRYLSGRPVLARPNTLGYVVRKFVRRNAIPVSAAALLVAMLLAASGGIAMQSREASRQRDIAVVHKEQAEAVIEFLREMLSQADPSVSGPDLTVKQFLDDSGERAVEELKDTPRVLAAVLTTICRTYMNLGMLDKADPLLAETLAIREQDARDHPDELQETLADIGRLRYLQRRFGEAEEALRRALALSQRHYGPRHEKTGSVLSDLGAVLRNLERIDEAKAALTEALEIRRTALGDDHAGVAETMNNLSLVMQQLGDTQRTEELLRGALEIRRKQLPPEHPMLIQSIDNLGVVLMRQKRLEEAEPLQLEALAMARRRYPAEHPTLAIHLHNCGHGQLLLQKPEEAEKYFREALEITIRQHGASDTRAVTGSASLARSLADQERFAEAERVLLPLWEMLQDRPTSFEWEYIRGHLESLYLRSGDEEKRELFRSYKQASAKG